VIIEKCKYSILIPSRNGAQYLPHAVRTVLSQNYPDCEVIVSVNHSTDNSLEVLKQFDDPRLKVIVPPKPLSMTKNFEWLLQHAQGEWIAIIGDDDGIMPYFFEEMEGILTRWPKVECVTSRGAYYSWGIGKVNYSYIRTEKIIQSKRWLLSMFVGTKKYPDLPSLYTVGVVKDSLIQRILQKSQGQFFHDLAPDVYSGVAIAASIPCFLQVGTPLFWRGTSSKSVGMSHILSAYGTANEEMQRRAQEFQQMSQKDGISVAEGIYLDLWLYGISPFIIYAAFKRLPFKTNLFQGKWVEWLIYTAILKKIDELYDNGEKQQAEVLEIVYRQQLKMNGISPKQVQKMAFLKFKIILPFRFLGRWYQSLQKKIKRPARGRLDAESPSQFPDLGVASEKIQSIRKKSK